MKPWELPARDSDREPVSGVLCREAWVCEWVCSRCERVRYWPGETMIPFVIVAMTGLRCWTVVRFVTDYDSVRYRGW